MIPYQGPSRELQVHAVRPMGTIVRAVVDHADQGMTVLLDSGLGLPLEVWDPVVSLLPGVRVVRFDRPGLGGSAAWGRGRGSVDDQVALLVSVLAATTPDPLRTPVVLVGHSSAALHVEALARTYPELVRALVLLDPALPDRERRHGWAGTAIPPLADWLVADPARARLIGSAVGWSMLRVGTSGAGSAARAPQSARAAMRTPGHLQGLLSELRRAGADARLLLAQAAGRPVPAAIPVTVLAATRRGWPVGTPKPRWHRQLRVRAVELSPTARVVPAGGAHLLMLDDPGTVASVVARVAGLPAGRTRAGDRQADTAGAPPTGTAGAAPIRAANLSNR